MRFSRIFSAITFALFISFCMATQAFQIRLTPYNRHLTPRLATSFPETRLERYARAIRDPLSLLEAMNKEDFLYGIQPLLKRALQTTTDITGPLDGSFKVDASETENAYVIQADLPGVKKEDVKVTFNEGVLEISAERKQEKREEKVVGAEGAEGAAAAESQQQPAVKYHVSEVTYGSLFRSFRLPNDADADSIKAGYENGVLRIELPKRTVPTKKTVEIL